MLVRKVVTSALLLAAISAAAVWSNSALDNLDIANEGAFTVQQRKENAARNQAEWDRARPLSLWRRIFGAKAAPLNLAIEINRRESGALAKYGFVVVTNLSDQTVTLTEVRVNRRSDAECSLDPAKREGISALAAIIDPAMGNSPVLPTGRSITVGTSAMVTGGCGSILMVSVDTDKGSAEYEINWQ